MDGRAPGSGDRGLCIGVITGGSLIVVGALLPWLTLFAGLQRYPGTTGVYGWLILAAGSAAVLGGLWGLRWYRQWLRWAGATLGVTLFIFAAWLIAGLYQTMSRQAGPMLAPRPGPGLFVVLAGAGLLAVVPLLRHRARLGRGPTAGDESSLTA
jgi:hypothetical protein